MSFLKKIMSRDISSDPAFISSLIGSIGIHLCLGSNFYGWSVLTPYVTSYIRYKGYDTSYADMSWVATLIGNITGFAMMFLTPLLLKCFRTQVAAFFAGLSLSVSSVIVYFLLDSGPRPVIFLYGIGCGIGNAVYTIPISNLMSWLPKNKGLAAGICAGSFAMGESPLSFFATRFVNPDNIQPVDQGGDKYFIDEELLERVPTAMLIIGISYSIIMTGSSFLLSDRNPRNSDFANLSTSQTEPTASGDTSPVSSDVPEIESQNDHLSSNSIKQDQRRCLIVDNDMGNDHTILDVNDNESDTSSTMAERNRSHLLIPSFWILCLTYFCMGGCVLFLAEWLKVFGQNQGYLTDQELANALTIGAIINGGARVVWGIVVDRMPFTTCCGISTLGAGLCLFCLNYSFTALSFTFFTCMLFFFYSSLFTIMPTAVAQLFGAESVSKIYGTLYMAPGTALFVGSLITNALQTDGHLSTSKLSYGITGTCLIAFFINLLHYTQNTTLTRNPRAKTVEEHLSSRSRIVEIHD